MDELLGHDEIIEIISEMGRERVAAMLRGAIAEMRTTILEYDTVGGTGSRSRDQLAADVIVRIRAIRAREARSGVCRVINATGVVIHTNLGRAPLSAKAVEAMAAAAGYASIEYDLDGGGRGARGGKAVSLLRMLTGAEDALVVNNCAAAAMLILSVFARGREVIVSRGELVEIGGDFRIPDVLTRSGAIMREVGTTNRTHLRDYQEAISDRTAMILKVHPSNYRITGFTTAPATDELADLAHENGLLFVEDAGSGALIELATFGVKGEPVIQDVIAAGADLVGFSGDKLLGGPQSGLIVGRAELVDALRRDPFYRALRVDKTITAALEATLECYAAGAAEHEIPVIKMLTTSETSIAARSREFVGKLMQHDELKELAAELQAGSSAVGGGASPDAIIGTTVIAVKHSRLSEVELERKLRSGKTPVITRIEAERVLIDLRTVREGEETELFEMLRSALAAN